MALQVFISYSRQNKTSVIVAERLRKLLEEMGYQVFKDDKDLKLGDDLPKKIELGIRKSCIFLLLISDPIGESYWVNREIKLALKRREHKRIQFFPVSLSESGYLPELIRNDIIAEDIKPYLNDDNRLKEFLTREIAKLDLNFFCVYRKWIKRCAMVSSILLLAGALALGWWMSLSQPQKDLLEYTRLFESISKSDSLIEIAVFPASKSDKTIENGAIELNLVKRINRMIEDEGMGREVRVKYIPSRIKEPIIGGLAEHADRAGAHLAVYLDYDANATSTLYYYVKDSRSDLQLSLQTDSFSIRSKSVKSLLTGSHESIKSIDATLRSSLGLFFHYRRQFNRALKHYKYCESSNFRFNGLIYYRMAETYRAMLDVPQTIEYYQKAVSLDTIGNVHLWTWANAHTQLAIFTKIQYDRIRQNACLKVENDPNTLDSITRFKQKLLRLDSLFFLRVEQAILQRKQLPENAIVLSNIGFLYDMKASRPTFSSSGMNASEAYKKALKYHLKALEHQPVERISFQRKVQDNTSFNVWTALFVREGQHDLAYPYLRRSILASEKNTFYTREAGCRYLEQALFNQNISDEQKNAYLDSAEKFFLMTISLDTLSHISYHNLGDVYLAQQNIDTSKAFWNFKKATRLSSKNHFYYYWYGLKLWEHGSYHKARKAFDKAYQLAPEHYPTCDCLSKAYLKTGNKTMADSLAQTARNIKKKYEGCELTSDTTVACK